MFEPLSKSLSGKYPNKGQVGNGNPTYSVIWHELLIRHDLKPAQGLLITLIYDLSRQVGACYATQKHLADKMNVDQSTVNEMLGLLVARGLALKTSVILQGKSKSAYRVADNLRIDIQNFKKQASAKRNNPSGSMGNPIQ